MTKTLKSATMTITDQAKLPLIADIAYNELFTSSALNRKFYGVVRPGIYRGFKYALIGGLKMVIGDESGKNTAYVERDGHAMTIQGQHSIEVTVPAGRKSAIVIEGYYEVGVVTRQVNNKSTVDSATMKVIPANQVADHHVVVYEVDVPTGEKNLTPDMILEDNRIAGGMDIQSHIDVTKDPHKQYALRDRRIITAAPLRGGNNLHNDITLTIDSATTDREGVIRLINSTSSNSNTLAPTAAALSYERQRAEKAEGEIRQHATTSAANAEHNAKTHADEVSTAAKNEAVAHADQVSSEAEKRAKAHADSKAKAAKDESIRFAETAANEAESKAKEHADSVSSEARSQAISHANQVSTTAKEKAIAHANKVSSDAETRAKAHADAKARAAEMAAKEHANNVADEAETAAKTHANQVSTTAKNEAVAHANKVAGEARTFATAEAGKAEGAAKAHANKVAGEAEGRAKAHAQSVATQAENNAKSTARAEGQAARQHADSVAATAKREACSHADTVAKSAEGAAKAFATAEAKGAESRSNSFATTKANEAESRAKAHAQTLVDNVIGGASSAYDTLKEIEQALQDDDNAISSITNQLATKLDKTATAVNSAKLEGKSKSQVIAEARNGLITESAAKNHAQSVANNAEKNAKADAARLYLPKTGNAISASKLQAARTIALGGDLTGSVAFDGSKNVTINATVKDNSHTHLVGNITDWFVAGRNVDTYQQSAFWATRIDNSKTLGDKPTDYVTIANLGGDGRNFGTQIASGYGSGDNFWLRRRSDNSQSQNGAYKWQPWVQVYHDKYHPLADKLTTGRTIALGGDATGSVVFDGSKDVTLTATVRDDSHQHTYLNAIDSRGVKPKNIGWERDLGLYFVSLNGLNGAVAGAYQDFLVLNTYRDSSGGDMNALAFDKGSKRIRHYLSDQAGEVWGDPEIIAYESSNVASATKLLHARTIALSGDASGSATFDGTRNITINADVKNSDNAAKLGNIDASRFISGNNDKAVNPVSDFNVNRKSGFIEMGSSLNTNKPGSKTAWVWGWQASHSSNGATNKYGSQFVVSQDGNAYFRVQAADGTGTWRTVLRKDVADNAYHPKSDKLTRFTSSLWDTNGGQDLLCRGKRALVGTNSSSEGLVVNYSNDFGRITLQGDTYAGKIRANCLELGYEHGQGYSIGCKNWFRSSGDTGWYNATHGGGIYMKDGSWVRTYGSKKFYVDNGGADAIYTTGGVKATKGFFWGSQSLDDRYTSKHLMRDVFRDITVGGDANTYYPVLFASGTTQFNYMQLDISRKYNWDAPSTWNNATHKGGLTLSIRWSGDTSWGGNDQNLRVDKFDETYSSMVAGMVLTVSGLVVWLRGGGAKYRITSTNGLATTATVKLDKLIAADKKEWLPRNDTSAVANEIHPRHWNRDGALYDTGYRVYSDKNKPSASTLGVLPSTGGALTGNLELNVPSHAKLSINGGTNKNAELYLTEDGKNHGAYIRYNGAGDNKVYFGTRNQGNETAFMSVARGSSQAVFAATPKVGAHDVYHKGNKPTAGEVGALPAGGKAKDADKIDGHDISQLFRRVDNKTDYKTQGNIMCLQQLENELPQGLAGAYNFGGLITMNDGTSRFRMFAPHREGNDSALYFSSGWSGDIKDWQRVETYAHAAKSYLRKTEKAKDSEKLNGIISSQFMRSDAADDFSHTSAIGLPKGSTAQRGAGRAGKLRFNTSTNEFEGHDGVEWGSIGGSGGAKWQVVTGNTQATKGKGYLLNANSALVTLPSNPRAGDVVGIGIAPTRTDDAKLTLGRNGKKIMGLNEDFVLTEHFVILTLSYVDSSQGWVLVSSFGEGQSQALEQPVNVDSGWHPLKLLNGWTPLGSGWPPAEYRVVGGVVHLRGVVKRSGNTGTSAIAEIPAEHLPAQPEITCARIASTQGEFAARIDIQKGGRAITLMQTSSSPISVNWLSLSGISYFK